MDGPRFRLEKNAFSRFARAMAWRIDEQVIRGTIDNRTRSRITGKIWFVGRDAPVVLDLAGNAWRDMAGRRLEFVNPEPRPGDLQGLAARQTGVIGDCTASRKVKVPEIPMDQIGEYYEARKPWPWHWGNSLYLEWFSTANGRVVIESASYRLTIGPDMGWEMTAAEEEQQRRANTEAMAGFFQQLGEAVAAERAANRELAEDPAAIEGLADPEESLTRDEAVRLREESDRLAERIRARVEREGRENYERILREELERHGRELGRESLAPEPAEGPEWLNPAGGRAEPARPARDDWMDTRHPLADRALAFSVRLGKEPEERGWMPPGASEEHPVGDLVSSVGGAVATLAGALNGRPWPPSVSLCTKTIVRLKRARGLLDHALLAAEFCGQQELVGVEWLAETQREVNAIRHACDLLTVELRMKLERGTK